MVSKLIIFAIFAANNKQKNNCIMIIVSGRDFRANQSKYITDAYNGEDVIITSRVGNVRIVPIVSDDIVIGRNEISAELAALIDQARADFRNGNSVTLKTPEDIDHYLDSL
jgi:antitoxin (DNA-binding transcriptional repressor) of toxin-antitoxin stability system